MHSKSSLLLLGVVLVATTVMVGCGRSDEGEEAAPATPSPETEQAARTPSGTVPPEPVASPVTGGVALPERYCVDTYAADNVDSVAIWPDRSWVIATSKEGHRLLVFDLVDGSLVREVTGGSQPFRRPNGIAIIDSTVLVVERDNRQVRVLSLPGLETEATFGSDVLRRPYGLAVFPSTQADVWELYVTDNYETPEETVPPPAELDERVRHFRVDSKSFEARLIRSFGATEGAGVIHTVESIAADVAARRLLIADETDNALKVYDFEGRYVNEMVGAGLFAHQSEGIVLAACAGDGYWVATDQGDAQTRFLILERESGKLAGSFVGYQVANTDGIALSTARLDGYPNGALVAVHDDRGLCVFDWQDVIDANALEWGCDAR